jgi:SAM-dependent methyltransferase
MMDIESSTAIVYRKPPEAKWPEVDLEYLDKCPVCRVVERSIAYTGLQDKIFFCAPGIWTSWRCASCDVVYLDPRPTQSSIGRAYESYYTHQSDEAAKARHDGLLKKLRRIVPNSYLNKVFGYHLRPAFPLAALALEFQPARALATSHFYRHLPAPRNEDDCLLDIGCGDGSFLQAARDLLNYKVEGLEIDPRARTIALGRGLNIHAGSIPGAGLKPGAYYQVTLNHVLEHLHEPKSALEEIFNILKPGGRVWISVPNIAAASLERFGSNSRLLEPPRHLVMFDPKSLRSILGRAGFQKIELIPQSRRFDFVFEQSWMIENGIDPNASDVSSIQNYKDSFKSSIKTDALPTDDKADIITMTGSKEP